MSIFYENEGDHQQNLIRLQRDLASDDILNEGVKRDALIFLKSNFIRIGHFSDADDFLQTLFAIQDLENIVDDNEQIFRGHLEVFFHRGDYDANKGCFLQRNLCVAHIDGDNGAGMVLELKQVLVNEGIILVEVKGHDHSRGASTSEVVRVKT